MTRYLVVVVLLAWTTACKSETPPAQRQSSKDSPSDPWAGGPASAVPADAAIIPSHAHAVLRPVFQIGRAPLTAGTAFVVRADHRAWLVTAQHLFGPDGGLDRVIAWQDMPREVTSVRATSLEDDTVLVSGGAPLAVEGAEGMSERRIGGDVAIFPVTELGLAQPLELADAPPRIGARVTLLAQALEGSTALRHQATVVRRGKDSINYVFDERFKLQATSGAPVVDATERVVAINLGGGTLGDGRVVGVGNSIASFGPALQRAIAAAPAPVHPAGPP